MARSPRQPILQVVFYRTASGNEAVREWLKSLPRADRKAIGEDIKAAQFGFVKKSQRTPPGDLKTARQRLADLYQE